MGGAHAKRHRVRDAKVRHVARPQRPEVRVEADLAAAVHLLSLAVELRQRELRRRCGICDRDLKLQVELVLEAIVEVPDLARPPRARLVALNGEPLVACSGRERKRA